MPNLAMVASRAFAVALVFVPFVFGSSENLGGTSLRGRRAEEAGEAPRAMTLPNATSGVTPGVARCDTDPIARMLSAVAFECVERCPQLCEAALPSLASLRALSPPSVVCAHSVHLACALEEANAKACAPALVELDAVIGGSVPRSASDLDVLCKHETPNVVVAEGDVEAAVVQGFLQRAETFVDEITSAPLLDQVLNLKAEDPRCANAPEGQLCVSSNAYIYCSNHRRLSAGATSCDAVAGRMSLCWRDGFGLTRNYCDDPFCRNGGAYGGSGMYCHGNNVVYCSGGNPPKIVDSCTNADMPDGTFGSNSCVGSFPNPSCLY